MKNKFITVACAIPNTRVADCVYNTRQITQLIRKASDKQVEILCFPELSITSYTCGDLFHQSLLINRAEAMLQQLLQETADYPIVYMVGMPVVLQQKHFNAAVVCQAGKILGVVPKNYLPNHNESYEKRWFTSAFDTQATEICLSGQTVPFGSNLLFGNNECKFGIELGEDLWAPLPPSTFHATQGATLLFNLSASNALIGKSAYLNALIAQQSARCMSAYLYCSCGGGESSTDLVFASQAQIVENGKLLVQSEPYSLQEQLILSEIDIERLEAERCQNTIFHALPSTDLLPEYRIIPIEWDYSIPSNKLTRPIQPYPFIPQTGHEDQDYEEIFTIQAAGLIKRMQHTHAQSAVIGISGGLDSTLALLVTVKAFDRLQMDRKQIIGITMPGFGTTGRTYTNALDLMRSLGITIREISIKESVLQHFKDIQHNPDCHNIVYENAQARERTQILMDVANQTNGLVIGTGDLSELALGWATYNGDQMSMYGVNASIPKTLVRHLVRWVADHQLDEASQNTLLDIIETPVSPELLPADTVGKISQKTEDLVGPYELHDFFLYYMIRFGFPPSRIYFLASQAFDSIYTQDVIKKWLKIFFRRFFAQQFKRSCMPDGPKVGSVNLSPRGDWRMPSDAVWHLWEEEIEQL